MERMYCTSSRGLRSVAASIGRVLALALFLGNIPYTQLLYTTSYRLRTRTRTLAFVIKNLLFIFNPFNAVIKAVCPCIMRW